MARGDVRVRVEFDRFPELTRRMVQRADAETARAALEVQAQAQVRAPVDTGFLRASIQAARVAAAHWRVTVGADYGFYVEHGTARARPQPFVHPAVEVVRPRFVAAMRRILEGA